MVCAGGGQVADLPAFDFEAAVCDDEGCDAGAFGEGVLIGSGGCCLVSEGLSVGDEARGDVPGALRGRARALEVKKRREMTGRIMFVVNDGTVRVFD
jgi:hypothetical protein